MKDYKALYEESQKALRTASKKLSKLERENSILQERFDGKMVKKQATINELRANLKKKAVKKKGLTKEQSALLSSLLNGIHTRDS